MDRHVAHVVEAFLDVDTSYTYMDRLSLQDVMSVEEQWSMSINTSAAPVVAVPPVPPMEQRLDNHESMKQQEVGRREMVRIHKKNLQ